MNTKLKESKYFLNKLSTLLMKDGKKKLILKKVLYSLQSLKNIRLKFDWVKKSYKKLCILTIFFYKLKPLLETVKVRKGSKYYEVPYYIKSQRSFSLMFRWIIKGIKKQNGKSIDSKIKNEFKLLLKNKGNAIKEAKTLRKKVVTNIIYSHYRWKN
jgi:ribosomal protein S7